MKALQKAAWGSHNLSEPQSSQRIGLDYLSSFSLTQETLAENVPVAAHHLQTPPQNPLWKAFPN